MIRKYSYSPKHNLEISTSYNRHANDVQTLVDALEFYLDELLKRCTIDYRLNIKVKLRKGPLKGDDGNSLNDGLAWEVSTSTGEVWYHIHLNDDVPFLELLSTLAHETTHVVQMATGRLKHDDNDVWIWEGKEFGSEPYTGLDHIDNQLPWEYDAYSREVELARKFTKQFYSNW